MPSGLTTTSFAILGWLQVSDWTTYELAQRMQANLNFFWPRVSSRLYEEPKNLVAHGLATQERSFVGKRPRTVYRITEAGRMALREWQAQQSAPPTLDFEGLVRVFFGETSTPEELLKAVESAQARAALMFEQGSGVGAEYLQGTHPFPERVRFSGFIFDFLWSFAELLRDWSERSEAELRTWNDTAPSPEKNARAYAMIEDCLARWKAHDAALAAAKADRAAGTKET